LSLSRQKGARTVRLSIKTSAQVMPLWEAGFGEVGVMMAARVDPP
jgi:hypothetical protein